MDESIEAECDEEIARISSQASSGEGSGHGISSGNHDPPRPMSWDGELSDNEAIEEDGLIEDEDVEFSSPKPPSAFDTPSINNGNGKIHNLAPHQTKEVNSTSKNNHNNSDSPKRLSPPFSKPNQIAFQSSPHLSGVADANSNPSMTQSKAQSCPHTNNTTDNNYVPPLPASLPPNKINNVDPVNGNSNVNANNALLCGHNCAPNNNNALIINNNNNLHRTGNHHSQQSLNNGNTISTQTHSPNNVNATNGGTGTCNNLSISSNNGTGNVIQNNSGSICSNSGSTAMILQHHQHPPMNLSFPRIPPSPDSAISSALGGWSTPSSNLSRHNSDASQRSFSSSSNNTTPPSPSNSPLLSHNRVVNKVEDFDGDQQEVLLSSNLTSQGISRQQLINSPCPICGDRISGFHYGIFSCESCKGFFKRTVQNRKNYVCLRGATCHVAIATRKKCPACRFDKCLRVGMKLEAIREDRTRGGRSTYACSYLPPTSNTSSLPENVQQHAPPTWEIPSLLKEIVECESLWHLSADVDQEADLAKGPPHAHGPNTNSPDYLQELCAAADRRLYRLVKWCKSLPLFKHIQVDDQTKLLLNSWCELLLFSCCYRSIPMPVGSIRINERLTLKENDAHGNQCITRMIHFTENLRRLRLDTVEYAALKVIILMSSEVDELHEGTRVRESQERLLQCLQAYTLARCPESPSKFGELLLKIPELQRICQVGKEMLTAKTDDSNGFNLLFELLRGDH